MALPRSLARPGVALALITDAVTVAYGLWTIVSTLTVIVGGSTRTGLNLGAALVAAGMTGALFLLRRRPAWRQAYTAWASEAPAPESFSLPPKVRLALLAAVPATIALWLVTRSFVAVWAVALLGYWVASGLGLSMTSRPEPDGQAVDSEASERRRIRILHVLAALCALFTLLSIRPRTDDPFYLSMSVSVVDYPDAPLLAAKTLHGPPSDTLPYQRMFAPYKVHSFETLAGYASYLTGIDVTAVVHFGLATLFGWLAPLACARFLRFTLPRGWLFALVGTISYLLIDGSAGRGFANQAFVRMFNGKAAMLTFALPMILYYGLRLGARPSWLAFGLLTLAQIGAVGMSSTAIWLAPMIAVVATAAGAASARQLPKVLALAVSSSGYVLAMGAWIFTQLPADKGFTAPPTAPLPAASAVAQTVSTTQAGATHLARVIPEVLGGERVAIGLLAAFTLACFLARSARAFRLFAYVGVTLVTLLVNPWLIGFVSRYITGTVTYERVFWLAPIPLAVGMGLALSRQWFEEWLTGRESTLLACGCLVAFYAVTVERLVISEANRSWLQFPPALKVGPMARNVAEALCEIAPRGDIILAPDTISQQLVTISGCGAPVITEDRWMAVSAVEKQRRRSLQPYVSRVGDFGPDTAPRFIEDLERYRVVAVAMTPQALKNRKVKALLRERGFTKIRVVEQHHLWVRQLEGASP